MSTDANATNPTDPAMTSIEEPHTPGPEAKGRFRRSVRLFGAMLGTAIVVSAGWAVGYFWPRPRSTFLLAVPASDDGPAAPYMADQEYPPAEPVEVPGLFGLKKVPKAFMFQRSPWYPEESKRPIAVLYADGDLIFPRVTRDDQLRRFLLRYRDHEFGHSISFVEDFRDLPRLYEPTRRTTFDASAVEDFERDGKAWRYAIVYDVTFWTCAFPRPARQRVPGPNPFFAPADQVPEPFQRACKSLVLGEDVGTLPLPEDEIKGPAPEEEYLMKVREMVLAAQPPRP